MGLSDSIRREIPFKLRRLFRSFTTPSSSSDSDVEIEVRQIKDTLKREYGFVAATPKKLQIRVIGLYSPHFIESGYRTFGIFEQTLATEGLPAFHQTAFHSHEYIRRGCGAQFEVLSIAPQTLKGHSDLVLLRRKVD